MLTKMKINRTPEAPSPLTAALVAIILSALFVVVGLSTLTLLIGLLVKFYPNDL